MRFFSSLFFQYTTLSTFKDIWPWIITVFTSTLLKPFFLVIQCLHQCMRCIKDFCMIYIFYTVYLWYGFRNAYLKLFIIWGLFINLRKHLFTISVKRGKPKQITIGEYDVEIPSWTKDGREIVFSSNLDLDADITRKQHGWSSMAASRSIQTRPSAATK